MAQSNFSDTSTATSTHSETGNEPTSLNIHCPSTFSIHSNPFNYISLSLSLISLLSTGCVFEGVKVHGYSLSVQCWLHTYNCTHTDTGVEKTQPVPLGVNFSRAFPPYQTVLSIAPIGFTTMSTTYLAPS